MSSGDNVQRNPDVYPLENSSYCFVQSCEVSACVCSMSDIYVLSPVNNVRFYMNYNCLPPLITAIMRKPCADIVESVKRL